MIQLGIIGAGRIGRVHVQSIRSGVDGAMVKTLADPLLSEETAVWATGSPGCGKTCLL